MIATRRDTVTTVDLYPAYFIQCKRCRQSVWINATTVQFGGDRTGFAVALERYGEEAMQKIYELDLNVAQLRSEGVNATPPGLNLQVVPDRVNCDHCRQEYHLAPLLKGRRLEDAGAFNCAKCGVEGFTPLEVLEDEKITDFPEQTLRNFIEIVKQGWGQPVPLLTIASLRIVVSEDTITAIDRMCLIPGKVNCMYCGEEWPCKLLDPPPLR
jgi:hypothetical protein